MKWASFSILFSIRFYVRSLFLCGALGACVFIYSKIDCELSPGTHVTHHNIIVNATDLYIYVISRKKGWKI